jgi:hypothetical protein
MGQYTCLNTYSNKKKSSKWIRRILIYSSVDITLVRSHRLHEDKQQRSDPEASGWAEYGLYKTSNNAQIQMQKK